MRLPWTLCLTMLSVLSGGCGAPDEIPGGTAGAVYANGRPVSDVLVTVFPDTPSATEPLGMGITDGEGRCLLRTREPVAPLTLDPGDYRVTVESMGAVYRNWPPEYAHPSETPLKQTVSSSNEGLEINVPEPQISVED